MKHPTSNSDKSRASIQATKLCGWMVIVSLIFCLTQRAQAASTNYTVIIAVTNAPTGTNGETITLQGVPYDWTTNSPTIGEIAVTNNAANSATNLYNQLSGDFSGTLRFSYASSTSIKISTYVNGALSISLAGNWATNLLTTNVIGGGTSPLSLEASNVSAQSMTLGGSTITSWASVGGGTFDFNALSNAPAKILTNGNPVTAPYAVTLTNSTWNGAAIQSGATNPASAFLGTNGATSIVLTNALATNFTYLVSLITTNFSEDTNNLYPSGWGTTVVNHRYHIMIYLPLWKGFVFTNETDAHQFLVQDLRGGYDADTVLQNPFYMGPNTNNDTTDYYCSGVDMRIGWRVTDDNGFFPMAGSLPLGAVRYGTNTTYVTNTFRVDSFDVARRLASASVIVDPVYGDDNGGWNGYTPFKTGTAAIQYAKAGQLIIVMPPGLTNNFGLSKNNVNWKFEEGAPLVGNLPRWGTNQLGFFDDRFVGAVTSTVSGYAIQYLDAQVFHGTPITVTNALSLMTFNFNEVDCGFVNHNAQGCNNLATYSGGAQGGAFSSVVNANRVNFNVKNTETKSYGQMYAMIDSDGPGFVPSTYGQPTNFPIVGPFADYYWIRGEEHIDFDRISNPTPGTYWLWSDTSSGSTSETSLFANGNQVTGLFYNDGSVDGSATWITVLQSSNNGTCFRFYGNAKNYITAQVAYDSNPISTATIEAIDTSKCWLDIEKIKSPFQWLNLSGAYASVNIADYQDTGGSISNGISLGGGMVDLHDGKIAAQGNAITAGGGDFHLRNLIVASTNNSPIIASGTGIHLEGVTLVTPSAWAISATSPQAVSFEGSYDAGGKPTTNVTFTGTQYYTGNGGGLTNVQASSIVGPFPIINAPTNTATYPPSQLLPTLSVGCTNTAGRQGSITLVFALDDTAGGGQPRTDITRGDPGSSTNTEILSWAPLALGASSTNRMVFDLMSPNGFVQLANTNLFRVISWRLR